MNNASNKKILIGVAWPYANGELHLGHVAGLIGADFLARYSRLRGNRVMMVSGTDCHGTPISVKAEELGITPHEVSEKYDKKIREDLIGGLGFSYDLFFKTSDKFHHQKIQELFLDLYNKGYIYKKIQSLAYCDDCVRFLPDRFVEGKCPQCGFLKARGDQCDECGSLLDFEDLTKPVCKICNSTPRAKETEHFFLKLTGLQDQLLAYVKNSKDWRLNAKNFSLNFLEGLHDRAVTRDSNWGISIPIEGYENKVIYVWFEAVSGYLTASQKLSQNQGASELWREFWEGENLYHYYVHGKDNIPFHTVIWPAILLGAGNLHLPDKIVSSEYLSFKGKQFSKSRNWGVWLSEFLAEYEADTIRYYLGINGPENKDSDFSWKEFELRVNSELLGKLGNFVNRALSFIKSKFNDAVPEAKNLSQEDKKILKRSQEIFPKAGELIEKAKFKESLKLIMAFVDECNRYFNDQEPWKAIKENPEKAGTILNICIQALSSIQILIYPFLPESSKKIKEQLNINFDFPEDNLINKAENKWKYHEIPAGHKIGEVKAIYDRVEVKSQ